MIRTITRRIDDCSEFPIIGRYLKLHRTLTIEQTLKLQLSAGDQFDVLKYYFKFTNEDFKKLFKYIFLELLTNDKFTKHESLTIGSFARALDLNNHKVMISIPYSEYTDDLFYIKLCVKQMITIGTPKVLFIRCYYFYALSLNAPFKEVLISNIKKLSDETNTL